MEVFTMRSLDIEYSSVIFWSVEWIGRIQRYFCYIQYMAASTGGLKKLDSQSEISGSHAIDISTHQCIQRFLCVIHQVCKNKCKNCPHRLEDRVENEWKQQTQVLEYLTESIWRRCETASPAWLAARRFIPAAELEDGKSSKPVHPGSLSSQFDQVSIFVKQADSFGAGRLGFELMTKSFLSRGRCSVQIMYWTHKPHQWQKWIQIETSLKVAYTKLFILNSSVILSQGKSFLGRGPQHPGITKVNCTCTSFSETPRKKNSTKSTY